MPPSSKPLSPWLVTTFAASLVVTTLAWPARVSAAKSKPSQSVTGAPAKPFAEKHLEGLNWRELGPFRAGRSAAVAGLPGDAKTYYFGATGGGVWKTVDGGRTWNNISDGYFGGSIGAVAVSAWDPNVVYVGGGEKTVRGNVSHGDGVWKSTDAGKSWTQSGLTDSRHIPRLRIHPRNPELVYAAVLGHLFGPSSERGVFRSNDGGKSWQRVLFVNDDVGAVDLAMDPKNPRVLYATTWRVRRTPYSLESGGPGSGLWKSTDSGDSWKELTQNPGLPKGPIGIGGIDVSPSDPENLYAIVESAEGGVFRSRDGGATWKRTNDNRSLRQRAWYYTRLVADPQNADAVWVLNVRLHRSQDGGVTFETVETPHGDNHDLWIAPEDPRRLIESDDGGAHVSVDGGTTWNDGIGVGTAQIYRVSLDQAFPYRLLGGQQDNSALRLRHKNPDGFALTDRDWEPSAGGESGALAADPKNPEVVYGGSYGGYLIRKDHSNGDERAVNVWPDDPMGWGAADLKYRFQWNYPIFFSVHDLNAIYAAGNVLFRSTDQGHSWTALSPDLTKNDKSKQGPSGGPITKDNTSVEYYGTIFTAAESRLERGVLWAGSDDGLIHITRNDGQSWQNVTPKALPENSMINSIEASPFEAGGLYVAATRYKSDDFRPSLWKTTDYGATWTRIDQGIAADHFTRVIRADPTRRGLLYAGTERGIYVSWNDGATWQSLQRNLPIVPITDLALRDDDLLAATQGRGFWSLDDLAPLRELNDTTVAAPIHLFTPAPADRLPQMGDPKVEAPFASNPAAGVSIFYYLEKAPETSLALEILDATGNIVRTFRIKDIEPAPKKDSAAPDAAAKPQSEIEAKPEPDPIEDDKKRLTQRSERLLEEGRGKPTEPPAKAGMNRFVWDLRHDGTERFSGLTIWNRNLEGPMVLPGRYQVRLTVDGADKGTQKAAEFEVKADPRSPATLDDLRAQRDFLLDARDQLTALHRAIRRLRDVRDQLNALADRSTGDALRDLRLEARALGKKLTQIEEALYQTKNKSPQDPLNYPIRWNDKLAGVAGLVSQGNARPTTQAIAVRDQIVQAIERELSALETIFTTDLSAFNEKVRAQGVPAVSVPNLP